MKTMATRCAMLLAGTMLATAVTATEPRAAITAAATTPPAAAPAAAPAPAAGAGPTDADLMNDAATPATS